MLPPIPAFKTFLSHGVEKDVTTISLFLFFYTSGYGKGSTLFELFSFFYISGSKKSMNTKRFREKLHSKRVDYTDDTFDKLLTKRIIIGSGCKEQERK